MWDADKYRYYGVCCHTGWLPWVIWISEATSPLLDKTLQVFQHLGGQLRQVPGKTISTQKWDNSNTIRRNWNQISVDTLFTFLLSVLLWFVCWVIPLHTYLVRLAFLCIAFVVLSYIYTSLVREGLQIMMIIISSVYCESKCISIQDRDTWNQWLLQ